METIVVDHGSTDGTLELVRERFPGVRVVEQGNVGYGGGLNAGFRAAVERYWLPINSDAWVVEARSRRWSRSRTRTRRSRSCVRGSATRTDAAAVGARVSDAWRVATEYFFLRKLAPRSRALNSYYAGWFGHDESREIDWAMGPCFLVRRDAADAVGLFDESFFMFWEETDWLYRFNRAGWKVWFLPEAEVVHVGGATHGGRMFGENVKALVQFFGKHHGTREAARVRRLLRAALTVRGLVFRGERGRMYRDAARSLR